MNKEILLELFLSTEDGEEKEEIKERLVGLYLPEAIISIRSFLKTIDFKYNDAYDYLDVYYVAFLRAIRTFDKTKSNFSTYLKNLLILELYRRIGEEYKNNYALFTSISLNYALEESDEYFLLGVVSDQGRGCPRNNFRTTEAKLVLSDSESLKTQGFTRKQYERAELQRKVLVLRYYGYSLEEIASILKTNIHTIRFVLKDDSDETPLGKIKLIFGGK